MRMWRHEVINGGFLRALALLWLAALVSSPALAQPPAPSPDPAQSINYWKPHVIDPGSDARVARAHRVFEHLLRAWDGARVEPTLNVVESGAGPWAASLMDGNILLSRAALNACLKMGAERGEHLLAFVLAHELAHQRADDLWHQKFFRLSGNQSPEVRRQMFSGLHFDEGAIADLERREARADHDGLIVMSTVGYDPFYIVDRQDFFTAWVENLWGDSCAQAQTPALRQACAQAGARAARARAQLATVAEQTTLFELGVQAFVAGRHAEAQRLFTVFGRDYPSRAVHFNIGAAYLAQALELARTLPEGAAPAVRDFHYPLILDVTPQARPIAASAGKRGGDAAVQRQRQLLRDHLHNAISYFEKAIRIDPQGRDAYLYLAMSYLLDTNTPMARGVLQGQFTPRFGADGAVNLLLAMAAAYDGDAPVAAREFTQAIEEAGRETAGVLPPQVLAYAATHNYAAWLNARGDRDGAARLWQRLAHWAQGRDDGMLFQLAVGRVTAPVAGRTAAGGRAQVRGLQAGERAPANWPGPDAAQSGPFWYEGEQLQLFRFADGARVILDAQRKVYGAWQQGGTAATVAGIATGEAADRPLKALGMPSRRIHSVKGEYLAYDRHGIALHVVDGRIAGWFLYQRG